MVRQKIMELKQVLFVISITEPGSRPRYEEHVYALCKYSKDSCMAVAESEIFYLLGSEQRHIKHVMDDRGGFFCKSVDRRVVQACKAQAIPVCVC